MNAAHWLLHGGPGSGLALLLFIGPAGVLYGAAMLVVFLPIIKAVNAEPEPPVDETAAAFLGEDGAREHARVSRRRRALRRRELSRQGTGSGSGDEG